MLYKLEIENFYSIRERQVIDLTIAPNVPDEEGRYAPIFPGSRLRAPKVVAVYGANGSGKTTVLRALQFVFSFVRDDWQALDLDHVLSAFEDESSRSRSISLALEFGAALNLHEALGDAKPTGTLRFGMLRYELQIQVRDGIPTNVEFEALLQRPNGKGKWQRVFTRDSNGTVKGSSVFPLTGYGHLAKTLRPNVSVLSSFGFFRHPAASRWAGEAKNIIFQMGPSSVIQELPVLDYLKNQPQVLDRLNRELPRMDVGLEEMRLEKTGNDVRPMFKHSGLNQDLPWVRESHGTQSFIKLFPLLLLGLDLGSVCVVDELDSSIHPAVISEMLSWYYDDKKNPHNGQIWFTCHAASLLENLNKEEVVLTEKDRQGRTTAYSLMDVKDLRRDDNLYRKYLSGVLGGVPRIG